MGNKVEVIGEIEREVQVVQNSADAQVLYSKTIDGGLLGLENCLRVSMLFAGCILVAECIPCTDFEFPDDVLGIEDSLPVSLSVIDSYSGYSMEQRTVWDSCTQQFFTVTWTGNHRSSWGGYIGEDGDIWMLVRDAGQGQWYNFFQNYSLQSVLLHIKADGTREELDPIQKLLCTDCHCSGPGSIGRSDEHGYMSQAYVSVQEWLDDPDSDYEHYFNTYSHTFWLKSGVDFYTAGDSRIGGTLASVRRYDYDVAAGSAVAVEPEVWSPDLRTVNPSDPATSTIVYSLCGTETSIWAFVSHMAIQLDRTTLQVTDYFSMSSLIDGSHRPFQAYMINDDLGFILQSGTGTNAQIWRWRRDIGFDQVGVTEVAVDPAAINRGFGQGFTGSQAFTYDKGYFYTSCNGWSGYSVDVAKLGQLLCPPTYAPA